MLTFSDPGKADFEVVCELAEISDAMLDGGGVHHQLVHLLTGYDPSALIDTLQPLSAMLFAHFATADPEHTAQDIAEVVSSVVAGVWRAGPESPQRIAIDTAAKLVASDFRPDDDRVVVDMIAVGGAAVTVALAKWVIAMSVTLAHLDGGDEDGGNPVRWFTGETSRPDPDNRVIVGGAAL